MLYSKTIITPAYQHFLENFVGKGMSLAIEFENDNFDTCYLDVRCKDNELRGILAKELGEIMNRDARLDPEFRDEISRFTDDIFDSLDEGEDYENTFEKCRIKAEEHEHPILTAKMLHHSDGRYLTSRAYQDRNSAKGECDYIKMSMRHAGGARFGFACESREADAFLEYACFQMKKMTGDQELGDKIKKALHSAKSADCNIETDDGLTITAKNSFFSASRPHKTFHLYEDDVIQNREIDPGEIFDDDDFKTLKASKSPQDRKDELLESLPDDMDDYPDEEVPRAPKM